MRQSGHLGGNHTWQHSNAAPTKSFPSNDSNKKMQQSFTQGLAQPLLTRALDNVGTYVCTRRCQVAHFPHQKFHFWYFCLRASEWKMLVYSRAICVFGAHLVYFMVIWYTFPVWVCCAKKNLATLYVFRICQANAFEHKVGLLQHQTKAREH
jgi:hypothetical protein